ncbi:helix-turn-helix domain-containing protein [Sneathiella marina]|uniref:Helix-turn-helix domain-containing protein n=1 Tax=Sneathiella marina TaxID=2950108 RepID=A0ABY4W1F4_9PROT|nr:helix-turn-helix domain-containing protein [Sneathiella marina]USG60676.1 helix-turn-helix domain-containing protein [Sneathiella marina]
MKTVGIVLFDGFPMISLSSIIEPLRIANRESRVPVFEWHLITETGEAVRSSSNIEISADHGFDHAYLPDILLILASYFPEKTVTRPAIGFVRKHAARNILLGCVDTGALLMAEAGILKNRKAAVHHESLKAIRDRHPAQIFIDRLFDFTDNFCSSAGGVATLDMTLALIAYCEDKKLSKAVAEALNYRPLTTSLAQIELGQDWSVARLDRRLALAVEIMQDTLDAPLPIAELARKTDLKGWQLRRKFQKFFGETPARYYLNLRLENARALLKNSPASVGYIGTQCGFTNVETLSRSYLKKYGIQPSKDRDY